MITYGRLSGQIAEFSVEAIKCFVFN